MSNPSKSVERYWILLLFHNYSGLRMMGACMHIMLATTFSMIITFLLHCVLHQTRVDSSLVQQCSFDVMRDFLIAVRCWFDGRNGM
jgi:hypothetical protein